MKVGVINYGVGNLGSVMRGLEEVRAEPVLVSRAPDMHIVDCLILPGVGNFSDCAGLLDANGWTDAIRDQVLEYGKPLLGVCVGMQLLAYYSMEGVSREQPQGVAGLGLIPGRVEHLRTLGCNHRVPHVGWNSISKRAEPDPLFDRIPDGTDFYFVHSYAFVPEHTADVLATVEYGIPVTAAVKRGKVWGTQFHPEKSSRAGFQLLHNFIWGSSC